MTAPASHSTTDVRQLLRSDARVFSPHPQVSLYFAAAAIENARSRACRAIDRGDGPVLVVGAPGTGKSLLLQVLACQYRQRFDVVLLACTRICTRRALLQSILFELGLPYQLRDEGQLRLSLLDHLLSAEQSLAGLLLLVDEAHTLSTTLLDELRVMTNLMRGGAPRVRLVMAGSSTIEELFAHPELESFNQRLSARCYLAPFSREETSQFVRAQIAATGAPPDAIVAPDALDAVFDASDGVPRLVNQLCDRALLVADARNQAVVDRQVVQAAWADLQQLPVPWDAPLSATAIKPSASQVIEFGSLDDQPTHSAPAHVEIEAVSIEPSSLEPAAIEPTELDLDDEVVVVLPSPSQSLPEPPVAPPAPPTVSSQHAPRPPRDPANPFAEQFDEEEVVLDNFATWDDIIRPETPRVENQRDGSLSALVQAAVETRPSPDAPPAPAAGQSEVPAFDAKVTPSAPDLWPDVLDERRSRRPRLRLVEAPDPSASEPVPPPEPPILIVEDEPTTKDTGPPVRRLAYQHLFSRLRSG